MHIAVGRMCREAGVAYLKALYVHCPDTSGEARESLIRRGGVRVEIQTRDLSNLERDV
jgi:hypothetical protein